MDLRTQIENYTLFDEVEEKNKEYLLKWIDIFANVLIHENEFGHFASSSFAVNRDRTKMHIVYHNMYDA